MSNSALEQLAGLVKKWELGPKRAGEAWIAANTRRECAALLAPIIAALQPRATDVDELAQVIREVDGKHSLGAGALAEAILSKLPHLAPNREAVVDAARLLNESGYHDVADALSETRTDFATPDCLGCGCVDDGKCLCVPAAKGFDVDDISLAAQMLTWGWDSEGLTASQEEEIRAHQAKLFAQIDARAAASNRSKSDD